MWNPCNIDLLPQTADTRSNFWKRKKTVSYRGFGVLQGPSIRYRKTSELSLGRPGRITSSAGLDGRGSLLNADSYVTVNLRPDRDLLVSREMPRSKESASRGWRQIHVKRLSRSGTVPSTMAHCFPISVAWRTDRPSTNDACSTCSKGARYRSPVDPPPLSFRPPGHPRRGEP